MKVAVLFDGAGLARLGLEQAGFECTGYEIDPVKVELGSYVGSGNVELADVTKIDLSMYSVIWASPPCQWLSRARTQGSPVSQYSDNLLEWCLRLNSRWLWVENVYTKPSNWGSLWNAAQFTPTPLQNRVRMIGGRYISPRTYRPYKTSYREAGPTILATEHKGSSSDIRRASGSFGRRLTVYECAVFQGFEIPHEWWQFPQVPLYEAIGNAVPVYMAKAFGEALMDRL